MLAMSISRSIKSHSSHEYKIFYIFLVYDWKIVFNNGSDSDNCDDDKNNKIVMMKEIIIAMMVR
jgi:hypothetical protein